MNFLIIHGDDLIRSREEFDRIRRDSVGEKINFEGKSLTVTEFVQALETPSLFTDQRTIFIDKLFSKGSKAIIEVLQSYQEALSNIVVWEDKQLTKRQISQTKNAKVREFLLPKYLFKYLESIRPKNQKLSLELLTKVLSQRGSPSVFQMLVWHFRHLIAVQEANFNIYFKIDNWRIKKLKQQSGHFSTQKLKALDHQLLMIDLNQKSGASTNLDQELINFTLMATAVS